MYTVIPIQIYTGRLLQNAPLPVSRTDLKGII